MLAVPLSWGCQCDHYGLNDRPKGQASEVLARGIEQGVQLVGTKATIRWSIGVAGLVMPPSPSGVRLASCNWPANVDIMAPVAKTCSR